MRGAGTSVRRAVLDLEALLEHRRIAGQIEEVEHTTRKCIHDQVDRLVRSLLRLKFLVDVRPADERAQVAQVKLGTDAVLLGPLGHRSLDECIVIRMEVDHLHHLQLARHLRQCGNARLSDAGQVRCDTSGNRCHCSGNTRGTRQQTTTRNCCAHESIPLQQIVTATTQSPRLLRPRSERELQSKWHLRAYLDKPNTNGTITDANLDALWGHFAHAATATAARVTNR